MMVSESKVVESETPKDMARVVSALISQEAEAIAQYEAALAGIKFSEGADEVAKEIEEIKGDEQNHLGRLVALLSFLDENAGERIAEGVGGKDSC